MSFSNCKQSEGRSCSVVLVKNGNEPAVANSKGRILVAGGDKECQSLVPDDNGGLAVVASAKNHFGHCSRTFS